MKYFIGFFAAGILLTLLVCVGLNFYDPPLNPKVSTLLDQPVSVPEPAVRAFQYWLGLGAAPGQDPMSVGAELYKELKAGKAITPPWPEDMKKVEPAGELLKRYDRLVNMGAMGVDIPLPHAALRPIQLLHLAELKLDELRQRQARGEHAAVHERLQKMMAFHLASLQGHLLLIDEGVGFAILKRIHDFDPKHPLTTPVAITSVDSAVERTELEFVSAALQRKDPHFLITPSAKLVLAVALRTPHRVLNAFADCWDGGDGPGLIYVPVRELFNDYCPLYRHSWEKIHQNAAKVSGKAS